MRKVLRGMFTSLKKMEFSLWRHKGPFNTPATTTIVIVKLLLIALIFKSTEVDLSTDTF